MEAIRVMPSEIESLHAAVAETRAHFDQIIRESILPRLDRMESKVDVLDGRARETNGNVTDLQLWRARLQGGSAVAGQSWKGILAVGTIAIAIVSVVLSNT